MFLVTKVAFFWYRDPQLNNIATLQVYKGAYEQRRSEERRLVILFRGEGLDLLILGGVIVLGVGTPMRTDRELKTVALKLTTV